MNMLPINSVRGRIQRYIAERVGLLGNTVIEVGSRLPDGAGEWANNRLLAPANTSWTGVDIQFGRGVDQVCSAEDLVFRHDSFTGALCSEVLEHVRDPQAALNEMYRVVQPGGFVVITTLTAFPIHGYPDDYWRFTENGLRLLLQKAGFAHIEVESAGRVEFTLNDHGEPGHVYRNCPMHVFATAQVGA